jgi:hypothetical protein
MASYDRDDKATGHVSFGDRLQWLRDPVAGVGLRGANAEGFTSWCGSLRLMGAALRVFLTHTSELRQYPRKR